MSSKVAIVTGSNKGIGFAIVKALCSKFDGDVFLTSRNEDRGLEAVMKLENEGLRAKYHQLDVNDVESIKRLRDNTVSTYGGIDILINNAGIAFKKADTTPFATEVKLTLATNFFGTLDVSKLLLPHIRPNGRVVNVSSILGSTNLQKCSFALQKTFRSESITEEELVEKMKEFITFSQDGTHIENGWPDSAYGVSKIGVTVLSRIHARSLCKQQRNDILLNACCPGWVKTDMGGPRAPKTPDEGAETPVYLALLPIGETEPHGQLLWDKTIQSW